MSFVNFTTKRSHSFFGEFLEILPGKTLKYSDQFEDPNLPGKILVTINFKEVIGGTEINITQEDVPSVIPPEMCYLGWQESLLKLAHLVESEIKYKNNKKGENLYVKKSSWLVRDLCV